MEIKEKIALNVMFQKLAEKPNAVKLAMCAYYQSIQDINKPPFPNLLKEIA